MPTRKKTRISKQSGCIRRTTATAGIRRKDMIDSNRFSTGAYIQESSGKFHALIEKIRDLDAKDQKEDGVKYKHLIFTDIREASFGAKALAGYLVSAGYELRMGLQKKVVRRKGKEVETKTGETVFVEKDPVPGGSNGFALLQSVPLWKNPLSVTTKKRILSAFNSRPDNIHGEHVRIIILDSKFKEGIDLFDVKYVHLLEPPIATSDLKQAVGRATRYCGQKGLRFIPNKGWPLDVFIYNVELPGRAPFRETDQKVDAHSLMLIHSGLDLALLNLTEELTRLAIVSAVDYDLCYKINNFKLEEAVADAVDAVAEVAAVAAVVEMDQAGGATVHNINEMTPQKIALCGKRKNKLFPFTRLEIIEKAREMGWKVPRDIKRLEACELLKSHPELLKTLIKSVRSKEVQPGSIQEFSPFSRFPSPRSLGATPYSGVDRLFATPKTAKSSQKTPYSGIAQLFATPEASAKTLKTIANLPYAEFQTAIASLYRDFAWESPIVRSGCDTVAAASYGRPVTFTRTQDFIRHYLTPASPFKGLLAWHSVGTGKTCMAVAAATTAFEAAGYNILWVTRNALMADVYKNIFGSVCSAPLIRAIEEDGLVVPTDRKEAKRILSRSWFAPITYRMLQNALKKENALGRSLFAANPTDPLRKTFLIIDEIHKLQDGDLAPSEAADFKFIQQAIWKSYEESGTESVRPLLMTATPIADNPAELFEILNILITEEKRRLPPLDEFREKFVDEQGRISREGREFFQERAKGLISYLNREFDPTTFAQPRFHSVVVPVGEARVPTLDTLVDTCTADITVPEQDSGAAAASDCDMLTKEMEQEIAMVQKRQVIAEIKREFKHRIRTCKAERKRAQKAHEAAMKMVVKEATKCFRKTRKAHTALRNASQLKAVEKCLAKPTPSAFPSLADFKEFVQHKYEKREEGDFSSVNAVKLSDNE